LTTASIKEFFRFPFRGPDWKNRFLIGAALSLAGFIIPILPLIVVYGYFMEVMRRVIEQGEIVLPAWDDWGKLALDGLRALGVGLVYLLPGQVVFWGGFLLYMVVSFSFPFFMVAAEGNQAAVAGPLALLGSMAVMFVSILLGSLLTLLGAVPLPMALAHVAAKGEFGAAFRFRQWWTLLRANKLGYFVAWVLFAGLTAMGYFATTMAYYTIVLCCLIPFLGAPVGFYLFSVGAAVFGQTYRESTAMAAAPGAAH
jgi:hypothetical protein